MGKKSLSEQDIRTKFITPAIEQAGWDLMTQLREEQQLTNGQILGRGTRVNDDFGKYYFTIMDFKKATELFAHPDFDGDPVRIYTPGPNDPVLPPDDDDSATLDDQGETIIIDPGPPEGDDFGEGDSWGGNNPPPTGPKKYYVKDVPVSVIGERIQYYGNDGKLITESLRDYTRRTVTAEFESLDLFLQKWSEAGKKQAIAEELEEQGLLLEALHEEVGKDFSAFDLICHVVFSQPPLTRRERAENVRKRDYFTKYGEQARTVLDTLLDKFADEGAMSIEDVSMLRVSPFDQFGTPVAIVKLFGGKAGFLRTAEELESVLYSEAG